MANKGYVLQSSDDDIHNVSNILKVTDSIDLKSVAASTIYTVPTGKKLILQDEGSLVEKLKYGKTTGDD